MKLAEFPPLCLAKHDPNAGLQGPYTIELEIPPGQSLTGPVTVIAVKKDWSDTPLGGGDTLVASNISLGQISGSPNVWGISFNLQNGSAQTYWLRVAALRDTSPPYGVHRTVRLVCRNN